MKPSIFISAVYIGENTGSETFNKGTSYILKISFDDTLIFPISVEYKYKKNYKYLSYKSIVLFLKDWTEIITMIDQKEAERNFKYAYDDSEDELPFKTPELRERKLPNAKLIPLGTWRCVHCKALNYSPSASRCAYCNEVRPEFEV